MAKKEIPNWNVGDKVTVTRRNGDEVRGVVKTANYTKGKGEWVDVDLLDDKNKPSGLSVTQRPSQLVKRR